MVVVHGEPAGGRVRLAGQSRSGRSRRAVCAITNITNDMVRHAPRFAELAERVLAALAGRVFVAHNARFDWDFVSAELRRARDLALDGPRLCTVRLARRLVKGVRSCGLDNLTPLLRLREPRPAPRRGRRAGDRRAARAAARAWRARRVRATLQDLARDRARRRTGGGGAGAAGHADRAADGLLPARSCA